MTSIAQGNAIRQSEHLRKQSGDAFDVMHVASSPPAFSAGITLSGQDILDPILHCFGTTDVAGDKGDTTLPKIVVSSATVKRQSLVAADHRTSLMELGVARSYLLGNTAMQAGEVYKGTPFRFPVTRVGTILAPRLGRCSDGKGLTTLGTNVSQVLCLHTENTITMADILSKRNRVNSVNAKRNERKPIPSQAADTSAEGVETTGGVRVPLMTGKSARRPNWVEDIVQSAKKLAIRLHGNRKDHHHQQLLLCRLRIGRRGEADGERRSGEPLPA